MAEEPCATSATDACWLVFDVPLLDILTLARTDVVRVQFCRFSTRRCAFRQVATILESRTAFTDDFRFCRPSRDAQMIL